MAIERLSYSGYQPVGTVIGEASGIGSTNANTDKHVLAIPGRGSRYILEKNTSLTRGYIYNEPLSFSSTAPHTAPLQSTANGSTASATLVDSEGIEVRKDFWRFGSDNVTIIIGDPAFDPTKSYFLSYQSSDRTVADPIPTDSIRTIAAVGSQIDQDSYTRNVDYFIDTAVLPPVAAVDGANTVIQQTNPSATFSTIAHVGTGTAVASISTSALFTHLYSRGYALEVVDVTGTVVTFEWKSNPIEKGNGSAPSTPLVAGLQAPTFTIDTSKPQTLTVDLEFGVRIDFTSTGTYVEGDTFSFSVYGPSLVEVASALTNTNQFASASTVVPSVDNNGAGSIVVDAELYALTKNTNVVLEVTDVDEGVVVATVPSGEIRFTDVNPNDGASFSIDNGISGSGKVVSTFEFDGNSVVTAGSSKITLGTTAAVAATGSITFVGSASDAPDDGDYVTIIDGNRTLVFEFDINGSLNNAGAIRVLIDTTAGSQSKNTAANLVTAINASLLNVAAADVSSSNGNVGKLTLVHNVAGSNGNNAILSSTQAIAVFGFSGGKNITSNIATTKTNTINAINDVTPRIGVVAYADDSDTTSIKLVHGARFVFAGLPTADDTITINSGTSTETYVFKATAALPDEITIAGTVALTLTNIVTALDASTLNVAAVASTAGGLSTLTIASKIARNVTLTKSSTNISVVSSIIDNAAALSNGNVAIAYTGSNYSVTGLVGGVDAQDSPDIITFAYGTSGDAFASGVFSIAEGYSEGKYVSLYGGAKIKLGSAIATKAEGFITLHSLPADSDTITINDGIAPVTLTFKTTASLATDVQIVSGDIATTTNNLLSKIASQPLYVDGSKTSTNTIKLVHRKTGATYNNAITFTGTALTVAGLAGGASNYVAGDRYSFTLLAPRKFTTALDDRKVTLTVGTVGIETPDVSDHGYVLFSFSSDTPEGGWGDVEATSANDGYFTLPGQIALVARNTHANISTNGNNLNRFVTGDKFTVVYINNNTIIWTLDKKATESKESADVLFDRNGSVTGKAATYYVVLKNKPYAGTIKVTNAGVAYTGWSLLAGTNIIVLSVKNASAVSGMLISYTHAGSEPSLGSSYYVTANYLRPIEYYNEPRVFYGREEALAFVAPVTADNDLAIGINIVYDQEVAPQAIAIVQIRDSDDDGVFSPADIDTALSHCAGVNYITEFVPLRLSQYLDKFLAFNVQRNDPFAKSEHIFGYGAPIGTPVGSELDEGSLIFTARRTLQVYGNSPAHGKRFMIASTRARKKTTLTDGTVINPYLDGSFIALAIAGKICGQNNNDSTILNTNILGFNEVEVFNDATNRLLGGASIIYLENNGTNVYRLKEDVTVDDSRSDYHEILSVRTKIDATRTVRRECDRQIIGFVPPTKAAGVATIKAKIIGILNAMVANGTIAPYQDSEGNARRILPTDVNVIRDENDPTLFHFTYWFFTKSAVKRLLGLYSVNENVFTPQA
jgi:hypothetical protein